VKRLLKKLKCQRDDFEISDLVQEMNQVKDKYDIYPTIIFDVEHAGVEHKELGTEAVRSLSKALAGTCRIIILSEANAVLQFGQDGARERFIFVDELAESEAF
jgi:hypothetical protein